MNRSEAPRPRQAVAGGFARLPIAIAGGGIAGLTAAIALVRKDQRVAVFERAAQPNESGAGIQLSPNAVRVLSRLGLAVPLYEQSLRPEAVEIRDTRSGRLLAATPLAGEAERRHGAPYCVLGRTALHRLLTEAAIRAGALLCYSSEVDTWEMTSGRAMISFAGGNAFEARGLVGADGLWSRVRTGVNPRYGPTATSKVAWRATLPPSKVTAHARRPIVTLWLAPRLHAVHYPIDGEGTLNLVVVAEGKVERAGWDSPAEGAELRERAARLAPALIETISAADAWRTWPLFEIRPRAPSGVGPVTLIGDAAHPMLPFAAQGAGMAIEDAIVLADAVAAFPSDLAGAFRAYERARRRRVAQAAALARRNGRIFHLAPPFAVARDLVLSSLSGAALLARLDWLYGGGPVPAHSGGT